MTNFTLSTDVTTLQIVSDAGFGYISASGSVTVPTFSAVLINNGGSLTVAGAAMGGTGGFGANFYGLGDGLVNVASSGVMFGASGVRMNIAGYTGKINNAGLISGDSEGISVLAASAIIMNSGAVYGNDYSAVHVTAGSTSYLSNAGQIQGSAIGYWQDGGAGSVISNSGRIFGANYSIVTANNADRVTNSGVLAGDVLLGGGADSLFGQGGVQDAVFGGAGNDSLVGGAGDERLDGGADNDTLRGNGGDDRLLGQAGIDVLVAGLGEDTVDGGIGADWVYGGAGDDVLGGAADNDRLIGGAGSDVMNGGLGADIFVFSQGHGNDRIVSFADNIDKLDLRGFDIASLAALKAHASDSSLGVRIDLRSFDGGTITLTGMTLAGLTVQDFYF